MDGFRDFFVVKTRGDPKIKKSNFHINDPLCPPTGGAKTDTQKPIPFFGGKKPIPKNRYLASFQKKKTDTRKRYFS